MNDEEFWSALLQCAQLWNSAERAVKEAELLLGEAVIPCINELRYAGRWVVLALSSFRQGDDRIDNLTSVQDALAYARLCCLQSKHDAIDSIIMLVLEKVEEINSVYPARVISLYISNYGQFLAELERMGAFVSASREHRHNRVEIYESILTDHLPRLRDFLLSIRRAEAVMREDLEREKEHVEKEHQEIQRANRRFWWSFVVNVVLSVISIVLAIITLK